MKTEDLIREIEKELEKFEVAPLVSNIGYVESVGDGIVKANGLSRAGFGEEVEFENGEKGLVLNLDEDYVSILLLSTTEKIKERMEIKTTGRILGARVSEKLLGRVIDPLGNPLDGKDLKVDGEFYPLDRIAPGVIDRQPVDTPLKTGIKAIDSMTPIGRGQRELIIGDRNTGKTAIVIDTIINQKKRDLSLPQVICIYCPIGQKGVNVARTVSKLEDEGAMDYTIVVSATASDSAAMLYLAPYTACSIGEYFMDKGRDVFVVYDDLSRHAWAYRQISLLLRRPAGREAYPGDIFYLHARLLERSARLSKKRGGGTLTAVPIIETQAGDVSSYIPTNVISITDGQIYLETDLFNAGIKPAINAGLSVSRVGGAAQTAAMKQVTGPLRLEIAQYRELASFAQFGSDLDAETIKRLERGKRVAEVLKQSQYKPVEEFLQIITIYSATSGLLDDVPVEKIKEFEEKIVSYIRVKNKKLVEKIKTGEKLTQETLGEIKKVVTEFRKTIV